jgi:hypothetical protein
MPTVVLAEKAGVPITLDGRVLPSESDQNTFWGLMSMLPEGSSDLNVSSRQLFDRFGWPIDGKDGELGDCFARIFSATVSSKGPSESWATSLITSFDCLLGEDDAVARFRFSDSLCEYVRATPSDQRSLKNFAIWFK